MVQQGIGIGVSRQFVNTLLYEACMVAVEFYTDNTAAATRQQFQRYASSAGKEVKGRCVFKINVTLKDIENVLFGKVRRRAGLETAWDIEVTSLVSSCYNSHSVTLST